MKNQKITAFKCIGISVLTSFLFSQAMAEDLRNLMSVSGECLRSVVQDRASVVLTADNLDKSSSAAAKKSAAQYNEMLARVKKLNLKDVELASTEASVFEEIDYAQKRRSLGFRARNSLKIESSEIERMGEVLKIATDMGLQSVGSLNMFVSPQKRKQEREACLEEAFLNAKSKADRLAKVSGVKVIGVARMDESGSVSNPEYARPMMMAAKMAQDAPPSLESRNETLQVNVSVQFLIK